ncbi:GH25 family lysozyme [Actinophytocola oryzae]|uniref:GH25 family lysozyme M1 (1,4-beta-N-acetylmuramidase) n=1 Tax=Actinophytocola oryzae TaxID=502181 RepID=A0A4R7VAZ2_9PSEU|nr:GH25 family lysozyme [Actinophytocola oryzae]TDV46135.1 GH25 family lysozyme M1 (1,4-beta-N-acetylmuramidase) [Actinophytocola oryzae]
MRSHRQLLVAVLAAVTAAGTVTATAAADTAEHDYPVVGGVVRDNVDKAHSPLTEAGSSGRRAEAPAEDYVRGIDVARYQHDGGDIDWSQVAGSGIRFVGVKATEGDYYENPYFADDQDAARAAGMYAFAYHFGTPNDSGGVAQADYFVDRAGYTPDGRTLSPVLDMEYNPYDTANVCYDKTPAELVTWIQDFVGEVKVRTGATAMIYTAPTFWSDCTANSTAFAAHPLWIANYGVAAPTVPSAWGGWTFWQYSKSTAVPGISGDVDGNYVSGGEAALDSLAAKAAGYTAATPTRVLDTRNATGVGTTTPLGAGGVVTVDLSGRLPATATAAVLNVTGIATATTYVTVWPGGRARPNASNLNLVAGDVRSNLVTVQVGPDRKISLFNNAGNTHLLADLAGWYATDATGLHTALSPQRVLDTRSGAGTPLGAQGTLTLDLSSKVPSDATAVTINLTGVGATSGTFVSAWPTGEARPNVSSLNLGNANATPNLVTVKLGTNRSVSLFNNAGSTHLLADLAGYYSPDSGSRFIAVPPQRLVDSRSGSASWTAVGGGGNALALPMLNPVPASATGVILNVTGIAPTSDTFVSVYPRTGTTPTRPGSSNLNLVAGQTVPNLVSVATGTHTDVWLFNNAGGINLIADLAGYFTP